MNSNFYQVNCNSYCTAKFPTIMRPVYFCVFILSANTAKVHLTLLIVSKTRENFENKLIKRDKCYLNARSIKFPLFSRRVVYSTMSTTKCYYKNHYLSLGWNLNFYKNNYCNYCTFKCKFTTRMYSVYFCLEIFQKYSESLPISNSANRFEDAVWE